MIQSEASTSLNLETALGSATEHATGTLRVCQRRLYRAKSGYKSIRYFIVLFVYFTWWMFVGHGGVLPRPNRSDLIAAADLVCQCLFTLLYS